MLERTENVGFLSPFLPVKEFELRELRKTLERARAEQEALQRQLTEFQVRRPGGRSPHSSVAHCPVGLGNGVKAAWST